MSLVPMRLLAKYSLRPSGEIQGSRSLMAVDRVVSSCGVEITGLPASQCPKQSFWPPPCPSVGPSFDPPVEASAAASWSAASWPGPSSPVELALKLHPPSTTQRASRYHMAG